MPLTTKPISAGELKLFGDQAVSVGNMANTVAEMQEGTDKNNALGTLRRAYHGMVAAGTNLRRENLAEQARRPGGKDGSGESR